MTVFVCAFNKWADGYKKAYGIMLLCKENYERALCPLIVDTSGTVIVGYEYSYDNLGRILSEIHLAENVKYEYNYDAAGNITSCTVSNGANTFVYDQNNRLI